MNIKLYRSYDTITDKEKIKSFLDKIDILICKSDTFANELQIFKEQIINKKYYDFKDIWYIEDVEYRINNGDIVGDLPF